VGDVWLRHYEPPKTTILVIGAIDYTVNDVFAFHF